MAAEPLTATQTERRRRRGVGERLTTVLVILTGEGGGDTDDTCVTDGLGGDRGCRDVAPAAALAAIQLRPVVPVQGVVGGVDVDLALDR